jgi:hypothetical protein
VRLLALTAQRRDEVARMAWPDLDLERRLWTLPRALTKADRLHEVPLSDLALEVITALPRIGDDLLFPANRYGTPRPVSGFSNAKTRLDRLSGVSGWRIHDLRRTAASEMARLGHPPHVVAAILNHSPASTQGITAIYNRHRYGDEKRLALAAWGREVERVIGRGGATGGAVRVVTARASANASTWLSQAANHQTSPRRRLASMTSESTSMPSPKRRAILAGGRPPRAATGVPQWQA